jgi:hypothetical protein
MSIIFQMGRLNHQAEQFSTINPGEMNHFSDGLYNVMH